MTQPWFDPNLYSWIPGAALACLAAILACLAARLAPQGRARAFIVRAWIALWVACWILLAAGLVALGNHQPYGIWYGLLLPGVIGTLVLGGNLLVILKRYRDVEDRRLAAKDLG
jgi:hypothetical protein